MSPLLSQLSASIAMSCWAEKLDFSHCFVWWVHLWVQLWLLSDVLFAIGWNGLQSGRTVQKLLFFLFYSLLCPQKEMGSNWLLGPGIFTMRGCVDCHLAEYLAITVANMEEGVKSKKNFLKPAPFLIDSWEISSWRLQCRKAPIHQDSIML